MARQMKDSGIEWMGEIPTTWDSISFWQATERMATGLNPRDNFELTSDDEYFYVTIRNFKDGKLYLDDNCDRISPAAWNIIQERSQLQVGDILFASISKDGQAYIVDTPPVNWNINESVFVIRVNPEFYTPKYFYYHLTDDAYYADLRMDATGSTFQSIKQNKLSKSRLVLPPLAEQHRIAAFLDRKCAEIDAVIERTKATIEEYKKLKQAVITEAVTKGVRGSRPMKDSGIEWIGEIPEGWEVAPLKYFITGYKAGPFGSSLITDKLNSSGTILVYTPEHVAKKTAELEFNLYLPDERREEMQQFVVTPGDIIFPIVGSLGRSMLVTDDMPMGIINQRLAKFRLSASTLAIEYFLWLFSKSSFYNTYIDLNCRGSIIVNLTKQIVYDMPVPHPMDLSEQAEIVAYLNEKCAALDTLIAKKTALLTELETYKKSLIYEYVTGKKEV